MPKEEDLKAVETRLRSINKFAPIVRSTQAKVSADQVLNIKAFDLEKTLEMDPEFLDTEGEHEHDDSVTTRKRTNIETKRKYSIAITKHNKETKYNNEVMKTQCEDMHAVRINIKTYTNPTEKLPINKSGF